VLTGAGFDVVRARDGAEALQRVRESEPQLVVLDVSMPELDGLQVLERLRDDPATESLPVVMLSARAQESDVERGYRIGASKYVVKPFKPAELAGIARDLVA
jgi:CheY-like chemotaxis protein